MVAIFNSHDKRTHEPNKKNLCTTRQNMSAMEEEMHSQEEQNDPTEMFCFAALAKEFNHRIYSNATGKFPVPSLKGHKYVMIIYVYNANAILARPMKNREKETIIDIFKNVYQFVKQRKLSPKVHIMANEC